MHRFITLLLPIALAPGLVHAKNQDDLGTVDKTMMQSSSHSSDAVATSRLSNSKAPSPQSYILNLNSQRLVFLDTPYFINAQTKGFFYQIIKAETPKIMQMVHTTANCQEKTFRLDSSTIVSLDPPKVLNYDVLTKGWNPVEDGVDQAIFTYVCFNDVTTGYILEAPTGQVALMYYHYLNQKSNP